MSNVPDDLPVVVFFEDRHAYYSPTHGKLTGMTSLIGHWTPEFQRDYWLSNAAFKAVLGEDRWREIKNERWKGIIAPPKEFYFTMWEEMNSDQRALFREEKKKVEVEWELKNAYACMYGSRYHAKRESEDIEAGGAVHPVTGEFMEIPMMPDKRHGDNAALAENLYDLPDGYYPELLIHDLEAGVCGMVDRAWLRTQDSIRYFAFKDYKTNKKKGGFETLLPPFNHLTSDKLTQYSLQASGYGYMLEKHGFTYEYMALEWVKDFGEGGIVEEELPYLREDMEMMFELYKNGDLPDKLNFGIS